MRGPEDKAFWMDATQDKSRRSLTLKSYFIRVAVAIALFLAIWLAIGH
jgi:hypothetical protein